MKASSRYLTLIIFGALVAGCATTAPNELVNARSAYQVASEGPAQQLAPAELHKAKEALYLAEQSYLKEPKSYKTKDLAYVAERKSKQAGAIGSTAAAKKYKEGANADFQQKQADLVKQGKQDLSDSERRAAASLAEMEKQAELKSAKDKADADYQRQQARIKQGEQALSDSEKRTADARAELDKQAAVKAAKEQAAAKQAELEKQAMLKAAKDRADADLARQQADTLQAQQALMESEKRTAAALASLASIASLKEEERGLVLTLTGSVLFQSGKSTLMPPARAKLDQVAEALQAIQARNLIVEGHTDSQGSDASNQGLSQRRADAVGDYLVQRGYPANRIRSLGQGEGSPVAKNDSAEGRANNRRVEIVIQKESGR